MINRLVMVWFIGLIAFCATVRADHLPENLKARGTPEKTLAGIRLGERTKLRDVIRRYGKPTKVKAWPNSDEANIASSYDYYWVRPGLRLHVGLQRSLRRNPGWEHVDLIEVDSGTSRQAKTGKGLRLGDSLKDLKRIYGFRCYVRDIPKSKIHDVMIQWRREEYSLVATLDRHNKITGLSLVTPE